MASFVVEFPLKVQPFQADILNKRFEIARIIYNSLLNITQKRYKEMVKTKKYRNAIAVLQDKSKTKDDKKIAKEILKSIRMEFRFSDYSFQADVKQFQKVFKKNIDSMSAQKIASRLWKSYEKYLFGNGKKLHYKKFASVTSIEGKSNTTGIRFCDNNVIWNGLNIPVMINPKSQYENEALTYPISYNRIIRKMIKGKYKYYVQIVFKGTPPAKRNKDGSFKKCLGTGDVGLDIGTSTIAISSNTDVKIIELADKVQSIENERLKLQRKLDRSRRATNPNNYNADGTIKKQGSKKIEWKRSKKYIKTVKKLKELYRKQTSVRKYQHECLANYIISLGDKVYVEKMNFSALQRRAKKTEIKKNGKPKRKKRFGKSIANRAPAMLLSIIDHKLQYFNKNLVKINTQKARASQFNHKEDSYKKKKLSQRWNNFNGVKVQRDMYSAFLIMNINPDLETFNMQKCNDRFDNFLKLHDMEVCNLKGKKNLKSIAI